MNRRSLLAGVVAAATASVLGQIVPGESLAATVMQTQKVVNAGGSLSLTLLDDAIDSLGAPGYLVMSKYMRYMIVRAFRRGGPITWHKNAWGERTAYYNDLAIVVTNYDESGEQVIDFNENGDCTSSIYVLSFSDENRETTGGIDDLMDKFVERQHLKRNSPPTEYKEALKAGRAEYVKDSALIHRKLIAMADVRISGIRKENVVA